MPISPPPLPESPPQPPLTSPHTQIKLLINKQPNNNAWFKSPATRKERIKTRQKLTWAAIHQLQQLNLYAPEEAAAYRTVYTRTKSDHRHQRQLNQPPRASLQQDGFRLEHRGDGVEDKARLLRRDLERLELSAMAEELTR